MSKSQILITIILSTLIATETHVQSMTPTEPTYITTICDTDFGNYTANSTYETNLKSVLSSLPQQTSSAAFFHVSAGSGAGKVHGQYYCRGDIDSTVCSACISQAAEIILKNCSEVKSAVTWYDVCTLRYHNASMFGVLDRKWVSYGWSVSNVSDPDSFGLVLNSTLDRLINESAHGSGYTRFAAEGVETSAFETTYFQVQCSPDLNATECNMCLGSAHNYIPKCCGMWPVRMRVFFPSCQLRYSDQLFYNIQSTSPELVLPPPPPAAALEPPPPTPSAISAPSPTNSTEKGRSERVKVGVVLGGVAFMVTLLVHI